MSNRERKERKRAGIKFERAQKAPMKLEVPKGLGLVGMAELLAGVVARGRR